MEKLQSIDSMLNIPGKEFIVKFFAELLILTVFMHQMLICL